MVRVTGKSRQVAVKRARPRGLDLSIMTTREGHGRPRPQRRPEPPRHDQSDARCGIAGVPNGLARRDVDDLRTAYNYANALLNLKRFEEAKALLRKMIPVAQRVLGRSHDITLSMRSIYAEALYRDDTATLEDLREAVTTLEEIEGPARRVFGGAHPTTSAIERHLRFAREILARETPSGAI